MRKGTRETIAAWREAEANCNRIYETNGREANDAIVAVGGWVTSSPDANGYCQDYWIQDNVWPTTGLTRSGRRNGGTGPHADKIAPYCPDIGNRVRILETEHHNAAFIVHAMQMKVAELYLDILGNESVENETAMLLAKIVRAMVEAEE